LTRSSATLARRADYKLCLSGTPMPHSPLDIYGQMRFLDEKVFGTSFAVFRSRYAIMGGFQNRQVLRIINEAELNEKFYSIADRVITRDVLDMPEERDVDIHVTLGAEAQNAYVEMQRDFYTKVGTGEITASNALTQLLRLQQITGGYLPDEDGNLHRIDDAKREALADLIDGLPQDEPLVVFARFRADLDEVREATLKAEKRYGELSGRQDDYNAFGDGDVDVIGIQIQAGAEGLNRLVRARYACYYSLGFSLNDYTQSRRRLMRPGQTRNVVYYHLIARDTVDERVYKALAARQQVIDAILEAPHA
jgi:SNF2 family DNA or RNA helicase